MQHVRLSPPMSSNHAKWSVSAAYEDDHLVHTGPACLNSLYFVNKNASKRYIWVFDGTTSGGTPIMPPLVLGANDGYVAADFRYGVPVATGIYWAVSSTVATFTLAGDDVMGSVGYAVDSQTKLAGTQ